MKETGDAADQTVGTDNTTLTVSAGLAAGTHQFYCVVTCVGYAVTSETATFTITALSLEDAEVAAGENAALTTTVTPSNTDNKSVT